MNLEDKDTLPAFRYFAVEIEKTGNHPLEYGFEAVASLLGCNP